MMIFSDKSMSRETSSRKKSIQ